MAKSFQVLTAHFEKLADFQMQTVKSYAELAMNQWKEVAAVRDIEGLQNLAVKNSELLKELSQKMSEDMSALASMGNELKGDLEAVYKDATDKE